MKPRFDPRSIARFVKPQPKRRRLDVIRDRQGKVLRDVAPSGQNADESIGRDGRESCICETCSGFEL